MRKVVILASVVFCAMAFAGRPADDKATFVAMYKEGAKMLEKKDYNGMAKGMTADFTETSMGHTVKREESLKGMKQFFGMFKTMKVTLDVVSCKITGNTAVVMSKAHVWGTSMPDPKTHKSSKIDARRDEKCTWVKKNGQWMMRSMVGSNEKMLIDGKPMMGG